ncbi:MAG: TRAP transporter substrate-binding protein DctP [Pseudomonadales bacterium]|nr:TRAP transporter substrate-binding protein DctP [Pseudomonadales bacterium]
MIIRQQLGMTALFVVLVLSCFLFGTPVQAKTFKIATVSPENSAWMKGMRLRAVEIDEATDGRVKFKFYPGGVLGDDKTILRKMRVGQLHGGAVASSSLTNVMTDVQLYGLPMVFRDFAEVDYVRSRMDEGLAERLEKKGYVVFGFPEVGFARAMSIAPITSVGDARNSRVWIPDNDPGSAQGIAAFNITPIPLTIVDVLPGLQTDLINAVAIPPVGALTLQWHTQLKYITDLPLLYIYGIFTVTKKSFDKVSAEDQATVRAILAKQAVSVDALTRKDNSAAFQALLKQGLQALSPSTDETREWRSLAGGAVQDLVSSGTVTREAYETMLTHLAEYRTKVSAIMQLDSEEIEDSQSE